MKTTKYEKVSLVIILIFTGICAMSFLPEYNPNLFGDWYCNGIDLNGNCCRYAANQGTYQHFPEWHWGFRHWILVFTGISLLITNLVRLVEIIEA